MEIETKQPNIMSFGHVLSSRRVWLKIGLRELAGKLGINPGNLSKIEKGTLPPPCDIKVLSKWATALGVEKDSRGYYAFIDCAFISQRLIPPDLPKDELLLNLPQVFMGIRNTKATNKAREDMVKGVTEWDV